MRLPAKVKIGAKVLRVVWKDTVRDCTGEDVMGTVNHQTGIIELSRSWNQTDGEALDTFLHECLHAMVRAVRIDIVEDDLQRLAFVMAAFLTDNKLLGGNL